MLYSRKQMEEWLSISHSVRAAGGRAEEWLCMVCRNEGITRTAAIRDYGDPRAWTKPPGEAPWQRYVSRATERAGT